MTLTTDPRVGKFYKFKPRSKWPLDAQTTLPDDKLYYIHPVIILSTTSTGMVTVVTTTSHPRLQHGINAYIPIGFQSPLLPSEPLATIRSLPKASYVCLDSRRTFSMELLIPFGSEGKKSGQFQLLQSSTERLLQIMEEFEAGTYGRILPPALLTSDATPPITTAPGKKAKKSKSKKKKAAATPPAPSKTKEKAKKTATAAAIQAVSTTAPTPQPHATGEKPINVQDIKHSLSGLKLAVAALEALCEKLEASTSAVLPTEVVPSVRAVEPVVMPGALYSDHDLNISHGTPKTSEIAVAEDDMSSSTRSRKRYRLEKWFNRLWKKRTGLSLSPV